MESLNEGQRRAVLHAGTRPLLVIAGAGTGKTKTLAHRVAHLVDQGTDIQRVLLLTFSRRAARELERRVGQLLGGNSAAAAGGSSPLLGWAGTFHAVGARLLRRFAPRIGLAENFTIHDRGDAEDLLSLVRHEHGVADAKKERFPGSATCLSIYSHTVNSEAALGAVLRDTFPWCAHHEASLASMFAAYVVAKQAQHVLDFDDLLLYWSAMMAVPELAEEVGAMFDHVVIDEYQDTNRLQGSIVHRLKPDGAGVTVVGDDAQSIYGFRAATVRNILDFPRQYSPPAEVVALDRNYRSTGAILRASNAVMALAKEGYTKCLVTDRLEGAPPCLVTVPDEHAQARCVAEQVLRDLENGIALKSQAVLFRSSHHSAHVELELTRRKIPYVKFGGLRFLDAAHVRDVLSILRWMENPHGRLAGFRALRLLPGIGPATAARMLDSLEGRADRANALRDLKVPAPARDGWAALCTLLYDANARPLRWPGELESVLDWYRPEVPRLYDDARDRIADLGQLLQIAAAYLTREQFLTDLTLDPPAATSAQAEAPLLDEDYLTLSTIHSAKGQEWKSVQVLNCIDGCIPSDMATGNDEQIEEERRLLYVAMTRAKDHLSLLLPQRFYVHQQAKYGDRHVYAQRSRFIADETAAHFTARTWVDRAAAGTSSRPAGTTTIDLKAVLRDAWSAASGLAARRP
ncbi:MAG: ATP-dependent helicase [Betaproteobacteria bacterium]